VLQRRLGESRASWEAELQGRVATAVQDAVQRTESQFSVRLDQARQEGRDASGRELADLSARCVQAEAALAAARSHPPAGPDTDGAVRQLREDLASAQSLVRARESELAETRHALDRARAEIAGYAREAEARVEKNRAAWNAERDTLLSQAEDNAQQRVKQALERWKHETEEAMRKAQKEWADAEETRLAVAEAQWRENIGVAKSRAPISKITKRQSWLRVFGRLKRLGIIAACLVAAAIFIPSAKPLVVDTLWPKVVSFTGDLEPVIRKTTADVKKWLDSFMKSARKPARSGQRR
jgi:chromosome segregation ATPase